MKRYFTYTVLFAVTMLLLNCRNLPDKKTSWKVTLNNEGKNPYGTYLAYQSLKYYFPGAGIDLVSKGFRYDNMDNRMKYNYDSTTLLVLAGLDFYVSDKEWDQLLEFADNGNEVVIFCRTLDEKIEARLKCSKPQNTNEEAQLTVFNNGQNNENILTLADSTNNAYGYDGHSLQGYFTTTYKKDTVFENSRLANSNVNTDTISIPLMPDVLGKAGNMPNFIRYNIGRGHITLHAAPLALSNYFLLQGNNTQYLDGIWQTLPKDINRIYWNEYYKRTAGGADLGVLWNYLPTRIALLMSIVLLLLFVFFEGKRRQKIIPVIQTVKNESVSFVETVGRLYYNKGNHADLAEKMIQQFLERVRTHYYLNTNYLNDVFAAQLAQRSGMPESTVHSLLEMIHEVRLGQSNINEAYLYQLYNTIQLFYKNQTN